MQPTTSPFFFFSQLSFTHLFAHRLKKGHLWAFLSLICAAPAQAPKALCKTTFTYLNISMESAISVGQGVSWSDDLSLTSFSRIARLWAFHVSIKASPTDSNFVLLDRTTVAMMCSYKIVCCLQELLCCWIELLMCRGILVQIGVYGNYFDVNRNYCDVYGNYSEVYQNYLVFTGTTLVFTGHT